LGYGADIDFTECSSRNEISTKFTDLGYELKPQDYQVTSVDIFKNQMNIGDIVIVSDGNLKFRAIAEIVDEYQCLPDSEFPDYVQTRKVIWHRVYEKSLPYERVLVKKFSQMTLYKLSAKTVDMAKLQSLLSSNEKVEGSRGLSVGKKLGNGEHEVASISDEIIRLKSNKTGSLIPFDREIINELLGYVRQGSLTVEDIAKKKVFEITASKLEKYIVNGYPGLLSKLVSLMAEPGMSNTRDDAEIDNRVLIIDEINRGNISSIFGELITLLEPSKRAGAEEALSVTLPYSKETFQVPNNLYLIGTMNTADRSLALMDTALRRRFDFVEMMPDVELLANLEVKGIDIKSLLIKMNKRIEVLYDREHILGHAFFIPLLLEEDEEKQFKMLQNIFENKILPLLEEYFFEDWEKIRLVLGDGNKETQNQFITVNNGGFDTETLFGKGVELEYDAEGVILYSRSKDALGFVASYIGIYES
jgi:5-methylcytosine-specific restriction protein B